LFWKPVIEAGFDGSSQCSRRTGPKLFIPMRSGFEEQSSSRPGET
jgi:hypothetical protein